MLAELWSDVRYRVRALFRRQALERELDEELRFHLEREVEKHVAAGMSREEALRCARLEFGGVERIKEASRDARGTVFVESVIQDLRYAIRGLRAKPAFTAGVVLTLALGLGANAAMFGIMDRLLFRPPAYLRDAARVHRLYCVKTESREQAIRPCTTVGLFLDLRRSTRTLSTLAGFATMHLAVGDGESARELPVAGVSASYFGLFDARPAIGRFFTEREDSMPSGVPVAVLGYAYWQSRFGGRADVLGRTLHVGRMWFTVVGVARKDFVGIEDGDDTGVPAMYLPLTAFAWNLRPEDHTRDYHWGWLQIAAKRAPGVSVAAASADLTRALQVSRLGQRPDDAAWARTVAAERPHVLLGPVQVGRGPLAGPETKVLVWVGGVALIVLLIACANVANLLLARALTRRHEIALRLALGVSKARLARQLLTESLVLATLGGVAGLAVAQWGGAVVRALFLPGGDAAGVLTDRRTLAAALVATLAAAVITGLVPALYALRPELARSLNAAGRDAGARRSRLRTMLLILQATLSVVLLVGAGLFVRSLSNVRRLHLGYDVDHVVVITEQLRGVELTTAEQTALEQRLSDDARAMPGVVAATPAPSIPFWAFEGRGLYVAGIDSVSLLGDFTMQAGDADYFRTMGTRIVRGRGFDAGDRADAPRVTVVGERMAKALWPGQDPLGKCIRIGTETAPCTTVVGIAEDVYIHSLTDMRDGTYYIPIAQYGGATGMLLVRVAGDAAAYAEPVRRHLQRLMPGAAYVTAVPLSTMVAPEMRSWRFGATMFAAFGVLALVLAALGLYSVVAYGVAQRRQEFGVRIALGASRHHVVRLVVGGGMRTVVLGIVIGCAVALGAGRWMEALLFHESPSDPVVYGIVAVVLVGAALVAAAAPAWAASRVDPNVALRAE